MWRDKTRIFGLRESKTGVVFLRNDGAVGQAAFVGPRLLFQLIQSKIIDPLPLFLVRTHKIVIKREWAVNQFQMQNGYADVVIGMQYGDEGKARIVDNLASGYDVIARFNGGANAGHTIELNGVKVALKQVPSGIFYPEKILYIGSGCMVNLEKLADEVAALEEINVESVPKIDLSQRLKISGQVSVIQPHHMLIDAVTGGEVGTTKNGIGPAYADKAIRMNGSRLANIRIGDLVEDRDYYFKIMAENLEAAAKIYGIDVSEGKKLLESFKKGFEKIAGHVEIDPLFLQRKVENGAKVLFEGAQSFMLDVTKGSVPYVTSSNTAAAAAFLGGDLAPKYYRKTIGISKAIMSRVGHGPFPSEFGGSESEKYCMEAEKDGSPKFGKSVEAKYNIPELIKSDKALDVGKAVRIVSGEYGTVTSRPRRVGAFDLVQLAYAVKANGVSELVINKCDLLNVYALTINGKIPLVKAYELDGKKIDFVPASTKTYYRTSPVIEYHDSFPDDISSVRDAEKLPKALTELLKEIENFTGCKVTGVGVGPARDQFVSL